jgi:hypothetical protein
MAPTARCSASVQFRMRWTSQVTANQVVELKAPGEPGPNQFVSTSRGPVTERSARASVFGVSGSLRSLCFGPHGQRDGKTSSNRCRSRGRRLTWVAAGRGFAANVQTDGRDCGRRVALLYSAGGPFACRSCYGLPYASQGEALRYRGLAKARKIRARWEAARTGAPLSRPSACPGAR